MFMRNDTRHAYYSREKIVLLSNVVCHSAWWSRNKNLSFIFFSRSSREVCWIEKSRLFLMKEGSKRKKEVTWQLACIEMGIKWFFYLERVLISDDLCRSSASEWTSRVQSTAVDDPTVCLPRPSCRPKIARHKCHSSFTHIQKTEPKTKPRNR